ncbi:hypothetical protein ACSMXN_15285 [Jatrophihabitans sp. DSM 45814]
MNAARRIRGGAVLAVLIILLAGCGTKATDSTTSAGSAVDANVTADDTTPATEGAGPEVPQQSQQSGPSISLASLPVGGGAVGDDSGAQQCVEVNWVGSKPIPPGINIALDGFRTLPSGIFQIGGNACPPDKPSCNSWHWAQDTQDIACVAAGTQIADAVGDVTLIVSATVECADQNSCASFGKAVNDGPGSSVAFVARHENVGGASESSSVTEGSPSEGGDSWSHPRPHVFGG